MGKSMAVLLEGFFSYLSSLLMLVASTCMALMALHVVADISSRLLFDESLEGATEVVSYYYMVGVVFLPLLTVRRQHALIFAEILAGMMSPGVIRALDVLADLLLAAWFLLFTYITSEMALDKTASHEFVQTTVDILTVWPTRWFLPIGAAAAGLYCLLEAVRALTMGAPAGSSREGAQHGPS